MKGDPVKSDHTLTEIGNIALATAFIALAAAVGYRYIGLPPVIIVGGSGLVALFAWVSDLFEETHISRNHSGVVSPDRGSTRGPYHGGVSHQFRTGDEPAVKA